MILADKIIALRKQNGWSQEELAEKLNVTRQSVSKWEGAQSVPDLDRILQMSRIFEVSTDYLLKDDMEIEQYTEAEEESKFRRVSLEEANTFLDIKEKSAAPIALGVSLCILSPALLILLGGLAESKRIALTEEVAGGIGLIGLLLLIAGAVAIFIFQSSKTDAYGYLETDEFETEYGVTGMVNERKKKLQDKYTRANIIGTCLCILAVIPLFIAGMMSEEDMTGVFAEEDVTGGVAVAVLFVLVSIGVHLFVRVGIPHSAMEQLLQEGEFSRSNKRRNKKMGWIATVYWLLMTAVYLGYSFITKDWGRSWIIWPVAGVLYAAVYAVVNAFAKE